MSSSTTKRSSRPSGSAPPFQPGTTAQASTAAAAALLLPASTAAAALFPTPSPLALLLTQGLGLRGHHKDVCRGVGRAQLLPVQHAGEHGGGARKVGLQLLPGGAVPHKGQARPRHALQDVLQGRQGRHDVSSAGWQWRCKVSSAVAVQCEQCSGGTV